MSTSGCLICKNTNYEPFITVQNYQLVECTKCGFRFVYPIPSLAELTAIYNQPDYFSDGDLGYDNYLAEHHRHEQLAHQRLDIIERMCPQKGRLLDVGCAAGFFLLAAQQRGWQVMGVELSTDMAQHAQEMVNCPIISTLTDLQTSTPSFDVITMWEYIEHIPNVHEQLALMSSILKPQGVLALSTPNTDYWTAQHDPLNWREYKPPAHLSFFTETHLRKLLDLYSFSPIYIPHIVSRAPSHPYAAQRILAGLRYRFGSGEDRRTPFWWLFSLAWRSVEHSVKIWYKLRWFGSDLHIGLEAYARKQ